VVATGGLEAQPGQTEMHAKIQRSDRCHCADVTRSRSFIGHRGHDPSQCGDGDLDPTQEKVRARELAQIFAVIWGSAGLALSGARSGHEGDDPAALAEAQVRKVPARLLQADHAVGTGPAAIVAHSEVERFGELAFDARYLCQNRFSFGSARRHVEQVQKADGLSFEHRVER
jgi:hypothetical protein